MTSPAKPYARETEAWHAPVETVGLRSDMASKAARHAVLHRLLPNTKKTKDGRQPITLEQKYDWVWKWWRHRLVQLGQHGWYPAASRVDATYMCHCPPFGLCSLPDHATFGRQCRRSYVCPHCYGRAVIIRLFNAIESAWLACDGGMDIIVYMKRFRHPFSTLKFGLLDGNWPVHAILDGHKVRRNEILKPTKKGFVPLKPLGAATYLSYEIDDQGADGGALVATRRTLAVITPEHRIPPHKNYAVVRSRIENENTIKFMLGQHLAYPAGLLRGNVELTAHMLNMMTETNHRALAVSGVLR